MKILLVAVNAKYIHSNLAVLDLKAYIQKNLGQFDTNRKSDFTKELNDKNSSEKNILEEVNYSINKDIDNNASKNKDIEQDIKVEIGNYTINQNLSDILAEIYQKEADFIGFSCYIWNIDYVLKIVKDLKKINPNLKILLGGPEVSYRANSLLRDYNEIDYIIRGEGEKPLLELIKGQNLPLKDKLSIPSLSFKVDKDVFYNTFANEKVEFFDSFPWRETKDYVYINTFANEPMDLSQVPFVYEDLTEFANKIIYYESSRGCPFNCSYCLSSIDKKLRFRDLSLVKKELKFFLENKVKQVKFIDRTFNCDKKRTKEIFKFLIENDNGITNFHFEVSADLFDEEELLLMKKMRPGLIQLEIGVQSTNEKTISEIHRVMDLNKLKENVHQVNSYGNIHQHLDLIAGLPFEDLESFKKSFNEVYDMKPNQLQLGFLKVLSGSYMDEMKKEYGLIYTSGPPYEVLKTNWLSYNDVLLLKGVEEMVEVYYNSGQFANTIEYLDNKFSSKFSLYYELSKFYKLKGYMDIQHKRARRYEIMLEFIAYLNKNISNNIEDKVDTKKSVRDMDNSYSIKSKLLKSSIGSDFNEIMRIINIDLVRELLILDYYLRENARSRPAFAGTSLLSYREAREISEANGLKGDKDIHVEKLKELDVTYIFDYSKRDALSNNAKLIDATNIVKN
ncbi:MAG: B12-binding domain-containing radical SAM protein [Lachnospiraceae bacterium]|jgi:radical SAM superfamily enzyme YgiQ (UPF0313 family)|nr:B12-binding domain-containing radical SAM protein [Lachnospiraceae bacterium]